MKNVINFSQEPSGRKKPGPYGPEKGSGVIRPLAGYSSPY
ncbi:hypothetical protein B4135_3146 [Caldibacillus debilis]|uniref:Uncharacterized protein n=1 Tax=Caldibacillus debilis TaxID=301148 RepID=A0A150LJK5_9BACI|nr:hypothetical protein B4135_3146 [Caldibacillus debilis]